MIRKLYAHHVVRVFSLLCLGIFMSVQDAYPAIDSFRSNFICAGGENCFEITPGISSTLPLSLQDAQMCNGFQTDITLPDGLTIAHSDGRPDISLSESCINSTHQITATAISAHNTYRVVVYSLRNEPFAGGEDLMNVELVADNDFEGGEITISNTILTLTDGSDCRPESASIKVMTYIPVQGIEVTPAQATIKVGESLQLTALIHPETATDKTVNWSSSDEEVAIVDARGNVTALGIGYVTITATAIDTNLAASSLIRITPAPLPDNFSVNPTVSRTQLRDGDILKLSAGIPDYGYPEGWMYEWTIDNELMAEVPEFELKMQMASGDSPSTETRTFTFRASNVSPEGDLWAHIEEDAPEVTVYRAPETPVALLRKGDGTSRVLVAMFSLDDNALSDRKYRYIFGYDDLTGERHIVSTSDKRYARYDSQIFSDNSLRKWCYTEWIYQDGSKVTSGLRYLDGEKDDTFDASSFSSDNYQLQPGGDTAPARVCNENGKWRIEVDSDRDVNVDLFTDTGIKVLCEVVKAGDTKIINLNSMSLLSGIYIVRICCDKEFATYKIYLR